ncbi:peptidoglycan-binding protein [Microtetraspora sp. NBRC 13810]|uniref:efflux RND transporter periplasmic adaptor subunit n=1 Tax=Microtetraspora sp. NBRC 13810 TaxID=3030990 RepID=UPI0025527D66|nr:peptidoglycan-binding protein [Microtetraspora sp. NBRC 13810]
MRRGRVALAVAAAAVVAGGAAVAATGLPGAGAAPAPAVKPQATAAVTRGDLVDTKAVAGRLTYAGEHRVAASAAGTVTAVPAEGAVLRRGQALVKVDRRPLVLMYGTTPLYRDLGLGVTDGPDVEQLERNLKALGYGDDMTVDDDFTYATHRAVLDWQDDRGLPETGVVDAAQVVFLDGPVRVGGLEVDKGARVAPGTRMLTLTGTRRIVQVNLDTDDQSLARKGAAVTVELPAGKEAKGRITYVGGVAHTAEDQEGGSTIDVEITIDGGRTGRLDQAPVTVQMESERVEDVLSVPVEALVALREGGFGVETVTGAGTRLVAVELGAYGGGRVEVRGDGLAEGTKVGVPAA